jgi:hypothetical protein
MVPASTSSSPGIFSTIMNSRATGPLLTAGMQGLSGYAQAAAQRSALAQTKPLSYWGAGARGVGGTTLTSPYAPGDTLTSNSPVNPATAVQQNVQAPSPFNPSQAVTTAPVAPLAPLPTLQKQPMNTGLMASSILQPQPQTILNGYA